MKETRNSRRFRAIATTLLLSGLTVSLTSKRVEASEEIIFTYGGAAQTVEIEELRTFAETGETSASLDFLLNFGNQNPFVIRWILTQEFPANTALIYDLLKTAPGEFVLSQTSTVVGSKSERANVTALRGALVSSASDDESISLMELMENYPTKQVYVHGKILAKARENLQQFVAETSRYIQIPASEFSP